jgi:hypothetical protein
MRRTLTLVWGVWGQAGTRPELEDHGLDESYGIQFDSPIRRAVAVRFVTITEQGGTLTQAAMPATSDGVLM